MNRKTIAALCGATCLAVSGTLEAAVASPGQNAKQPGSCAVSGGVLTATGLPTDELVNLMVSDASGTHGWVLGYTWDGTWLVDVPARSSWTTYEFASRTYGKSGSKYRVFASCSAGA